MLKLLLGTCIVMLTAGCATQGQLPSELASSVNAEKPRVDCVRSTGTRITVRESECAPGRTYTKEELDRTGAFTTGEALMMLDPSVTRGY